MMSFDPVSLFTNGPLEDTMNIILRRIYEKKEIVTDILYVNVKYVNYCIYVRKMCTLRSTTKSTFRMTV